MRRKRVALWSVGSGVAVSAALAASLLSPADAASRPSVTVWPGAADTVATGVTALGVGAEPKVAQLAQPTSVQQYWTAARMASATSEDGTGGTVGGKSAASAPSAKSTQSTSAVASRAVTKAGIPSAYVNGRPSIGIVFYKGKDLKAHFCTAFVVNSTTKNLIMMAAHCHPGTSTAFVPGYRIHGTTTAPYGIWPVLKGYTDKRYAATGKATNFDYSFAKVGKNTAGRQIQDVTHGNTLTMTPTYVNKRVGVTGYPKVGPAPADRPVTCWAPTKRLSGYNQMVYLCNGFYGGTSGSPWLIDWQAKTNTGKVIGLIGGVGGGGPNDWTSYSPIFDRSTVALYSYAVAH
ncbi:trypsin-like serine peptidase [Streptacidiphilus sp. PAMC 29251]